MWVSLIGVNLRPPQATRKGWPYYIRPLQRRHERHVYSRATPCGWPAWRPSVNASGATPGGPDRVWAGLLGADWPAGCYSIVGPPLAGGLRRDLRRLARCGGGWPAGMAVGPLGWRLARCGGWPAGMAVGPLGWRLARCGGWPAGAAVGL